MRRLTVAVFVSLVAVGCSQRGLDSRLQIDARAADGVNMAKYKTWNFARPEDTQSGVAVLDDSQFRMKALDQIEKDMAARGLARVFDDTADLKLMMHVATEQKLDEVAAANAEFDFASLPTGSQWQEGSLNLFLFDAKNGQMVWQGNAVAELDELADQKTQQKRFMDVVTRLVVQIPMGGSPVPAPAK